MDDINPIDPCLVSIAERTVPELPVEQVPETTTRGHHQHGHIDHHSHPHDNKDDRPRQAVAGKYNMTS